MVKGPRLTVHWNEVPMALPTISVQLSKFEHIEILREEIEAREKELQESERKIREILWASEKQRYLKSLHPFFLTALQDSPEAAQIPQLHIRREALFQALEIMRAQLAQVEAETAGQTAPPSQGAPQKKLSELQAQGPKKNRFDSFDDFKQGAAPPPPPPPRT